MRLHRLCRGAVDGGRHVTTSTRSALPAFLLAALSLLAAVVAGVEWLGKPLRAVHLVMLVGLSMTAGVSWAQAVARRRR
jgi:hypothetical protein